MTVKEICLKDFKNVDSITLKPHSELNILFGDNAQGKTNIIEALWMFTGLKSFRSIKDSTLIKIGKDQSIAKLLFYADGRDQSAKIIYKEKEEVFLNEVFLKSRSELSGHFCAMIFAPVHKKMIEDGPVVRRSFLNTAMCQIRPKYAYLLNEYGKALLQRNTLLKDVTRHSELLDTLDFWDIKLSELGGKIAFLRQSYIEKLKKYACEIYNDLSEKKERLDITFKSFATEESAIDYQKELYKKLQETRKEDIIKGITQTGSHRDDLEITVDGLSTRMYASQGQMRSGALALKLAEAAVLEENISQSPICLLDDVMSELDQKRQNYILNHIKNFQVFITCCDPSQVFGKSDGELFEVSNGKIIS